MKLSRVGSALRGIPDAIREERWLERARTLRPTDFVLDIGSGGNPDLRANVLCDKFLADGAERHETPVVVDLKHLPNPERAICDPELRDWFDRMHRILGTGSRFWAQRRRLELYTCYEWESVIRFRIVRPSTDTGGSDDPEGLVQGRVDDALPAAIRTAKDGGPLWHAQQWFSRRARRFSDRPGSAVEALLCCPTCRGSLEKIDPGSMRCTGCGGSYPLHPCGVPLLLAECRQPRVHPASLAVPGASRG